MRAEPDLTHSTGDFSAIHSHIWIQSPFPDNGISPFRAHVGHNLGPSANALNLNISSEGSHCICLILGRFVLSLNILCDTWSRCSFVHLSACFMPICALKAETLTL